MDYYYNLKRSLEQEYAGITGVGQGFKKIGGEVTEQMATIIYVEKKRPIGELSYDEVLPMAINGVPTDIIEMEMPYAFQGTTERHRPVPGGVSIGHYSITAGTVACAVRDNETAMPLILSNNHVLAASNAGVAGDAIYQPGAADGGTEADKVAVLERFVPIEFNTPDIPPIDPPDCDVASAYASLGNALAELVGSEHRVMAYRALQDDGPKLNKVDCAVARPLVSSDITSEILGVGVVSGVAAPVIGLDVQKSGRTTGHTFGVVEAINVALSVNYGGLKVATFIGQAVVTSEGQFSAPGDSGSLVLDMGNQAVGLLFAGGQASTIINPIQDVLSMLSITVLF